MAGAEERNRVVLVEESGLGGSLERIGIEALMEPWGPRMACTELGCG